MINVICKDCGDKYLWPALLPGYEYPIYCGDKYLWPALLPGYEYEYPICPMCGSRMTIDEAKKDQIRKERRKKCGLQ